MSDRITVPTSLIPGVLEVVASLLNLVAPAELDTSAANALLAGSKAGGVEKKGPSAAAETAANPFPFLGLATAGEGCCTRIAGGEVGGDTMSNEEAALCVRTLPKGCKSKSGNGRQFSTSALNCCPSNPKIS